MEDSIEEMLIWPPFAEPYALALRAAVTRIFEITEPAGVLVGGSIVQGKGDRNSDLDLYVLHSSPWRQRLQLWFESVPCEIFVNPPAAIEGYLRTESAERRPITAHLLATGAIVFDPRGEMRAFQERGREILGQVPELGGAALTSMRYFAACSFEDACDRIEEDPATALMFLADAVERMLAFALAEARMWMPRRKELLAELAGFDPVLARLAREFLLAGTPERKLELAGEIADRTIDARGFFEWEAERDSVDETLQSRS